MMLGSLRKTASPTVPPSRKVPQYLRRMALGIAVLCIWSLGLAPTAIALAQPSTSHVSGIRPLSVEEMQRIRGSQHAISVSPAAGSTYPWEGNFNNTNTSNGNKLTSIPIVGWTQRGGLPVDLSLYHNSQSTHNSELGHKWTFSYDIYLVYAGGPDGSVGNLIVHWGDDLSYQFTNNGSNVFTAPTGIHDTLVLNIDGSLTLTKPDQTTYHFNTEYYCDTITDENSNSISIAHNSGNYITSITDATGRAITLSYDGSNRISTITDPLSREWSISYSTSNDLATVTYPALGSSSYYTAFSYNTAHDITEITSPGGRTRQFTYNSSDNSLATVEDGCGNTTTLTYASGETIITDANSHSLYHFYSSSGQLSEVEDNSSDTVTPTYDASNNVTQTTDQRGYNWDSTFDSNGNKLTAQDPYGNTVTRTFSSTNKVLTTTLPTGEETENTYDSHDNLTEIEYKDSSGTVQATETMTYDSHGQLLTKTDSNSHETQYGYSTNGDLTSVTTPKGNETQWTYNGIGVCTSRTDAMSRTTSYTLDAWERITTTTYPDSSTHTFNFDADSNLTSFTDATGTTSRTYDNDNRLLIQSKIGSTVVQHTYDAIGQGGLLSTTTDANGRVLSYAYDGLNRLYSLTETAGTTYYSYDAASNETGITNPNGSTVARTYDHAGKLTEIVNSSVISGTTTTLSSFSYGYDTDGRRTSCTEASGAVVNYGYDWGGRLTSESRTGSNAYSYAYTVDGEGNRTSQSLTVGGSTATTSFTLDADDELTATSSSTGGFVNSYSYDANGEQTGRTLSGTANTLAYDYDGQLTSITQGSAVTSFAYDATGHRVSRTTGGTTTNFLYDGGQILLEKQGSTTTATYTYGNALIRKDSETPLYDGLGTARQETNSSQSVTASLTTEGFGNTITTTGSTSSPYSFAATSAYRNDGDAGLSQVGARYFDAQVGKFITRDTELDHKPYLYCEQDPVNYVAADGLQRTKQTGGQNTGNKTTPKSGPNPGGRVRRAPSRFTVEQPELVAMLLSNAVISNYHSE